MKTPALMLSLLLPMYACSGGAGPVGSWELDGEATAASLEAAMSKAMEGQPEAEQAMAKGMMGAMLEMVKSMKATMDIQADNSFTVHADNPDGEHSHVNGTWKLAGDKISMTGKEEGKDEEQTYTGTVEGNTITLTTAEGGMEMSMVFRRQ